MPDTQSDIDLLSTIKIAEELGVERQTVNRWVRQKKLTPVFQTTTDTGARVFLRSEVERFKQARAAGRT